MVAAVHTYVQSVSTFTRQFCVYITFQSSRPFLGRSTLLENTLIKVRSTCIVRFEVTMEEKQLKTLKVGFIGGGNMASAIGAGLIRKGILNPDNCWVSGRTDKTHDFWRELGAHPTLDNCEVLDNCNIIFLAVKPHMLDDVITFVHVKLTKLSKPKYKNKLFVSVLAGITLDVLYDSCSQIADSPRIVRSMPNTPMMVGEGITVYCSKSTSAEDLKTIDTLFSYIGVSQNVSENLMNPISGLSGCGPAFAYLIVEALSDGAVRMGVPRPMATQFAAQVLVGAGKMVLETGRHPGQLKDEVCSPGGITIAGVHAMEIGGVRASMINAVQAAVNKASELR